MKVRFGPHDLNFPSADLGELRDSNSLLGDAVAREPGRLDDDGYLLLRGFIDEQSMQRGREAVLAYLHANEALAAGTPVLEGVMPSGTRGFGLIRAKDITHHPDVLAVLESRRLFDLFQTLFGSPARTFDYKWLRSVGHDKHTAAHMDAVYVGRASPAVKTCWIPIGDLPAEQGPLAICVGSHNLDCYARMRQTYGQMDVDRDRVDGWLSEDPLHFIRHYGGRWCTTEFRAGDILTFGMHTLHASLTNTTHRYRISADVRFQPAHHPMDERFFGPNPVAGRPETDPMKLVPIAKKKLEWGLV